MTVVPVISHFFRRTFLFALLVTKLWLVYILYVGRRTSAMLNGQFRSTSQFADRRRARPRADLRRHRDGGQPHPQLGHAAQEAAPPVLGVLPTGAQFNAHFMSFLLVEFLEGKLLHVATCSSF